MEEKAAKLAAAEPKSPKSKAFKDKTKSYGGFIGRCLRCTEEIRLCKCTKGPLVGKEKTENQRARERLEDENLTQAEKEAIQVGALSDVLARRAREEEEAEYARIREVYAIYQEYGCGVHRDEEPRASAIAISDNRPSCCFMHLILSLRALCDGGRRPSICVWCTASDALVSFSQ